MLKLFSTIKQLVFNLKKIGISLLKAVWDHLMLGGMPGSGSCTQAFLFDEHLFTVLCVQSTVFTVRVTEIYP